MSELKLEDEIVECRNAVRKARVAIIKKAIEKMKTLKSCNNKALEEENFKKSERIYEKLEIMKRLKDFEVIKFALLNVDLKECSKLQKTNLRDKVLASLAKYDVVQKKINSFRKLIPNWEQKLPLILKSLEKEKKLTIGKETEESDKYKNSKTVKLTQKSSESNLNLGDRYFKNDPHINLKKKLCLQDWKKKENKNGEENESIKTKLSKQILEEKIDDPFFIGKKIITPKLYKLDKKNSTEKNKFQRKNSILLLNAEPYKAKRDLNKKFNKNKVEHFKKKIKKVESTADLHPSWAAKKVQLIKPFQGKKIIFSED